MSKPYVFYVNGMSCSVCSSTIENFLNSSLDTLQIKTFNVDWTGSSPRKTIILLNEEDFVNDQEFYLNWVKIRSAIEDAGFTCETYEYQEFPNSVEAPAPEEKANNPSWFEKFVITAKTILSSHWFLGGLGILSGITLLVLSLTIGALPLAAMIPIAIVSTLLTLGLGAYSFYEAFQKLFKSKTLTMDSLFTISTLSVIGVSISSFFVSWLPMMFEAGLLIYGFRHIGIAIEETIKEKISSAQFQDRIPKKVRRYSKLDIEDIDLELIQPEDVLLIKPGELIPVDSYAIEDVSLYDTIITGSILPRTYKARQPLLAGMRLPEEARPLNIRALRSTKQSYLARLDEGITQSLIEKAPLEEKTSKLMNYFIPTILGIALLSGILIGIFFTPALAIQCALSVIVSACPCTFGLIIPLAVKTGIHKAAEHGVQFKNAKVLQEAEQIDTVVFDLNGTLTTGTPVVSKFTLIKTTTLSKESVLSIASALEANSLHPIGQAIYNYAQQNSVSKLISLDTDTSDHSGVLGIINNKEYRIGSKSLMEAQGISTKELEQQLSLAAGESLIYLSQNNSLIGYFVVADPLRDDALPTLNALRNMKKEIILCTGADEPTALAYAKALGITQVYANRVATPLDDNNQSKPDLIHFLKEQGRKVAMVEDAANGAQAIAASDLGIAVQSNNSDEMTQKNAGVIIQNGNLLPIATAFKVSEQTVANIHQNLILSFSYNLLAVLVAGGLLVGLGFVLSPGVGVALMVVQACIILLNVFRFKHQNIEHLDEEAAINDEPEITSSNSMMNQYLPSPELNFDSKLDPNNELKQPEKTLLSSPSSIATNPSFWKAPKPMPAKQESIELNSPLNF